MRKLISETIVDSFELFIEKGREQIKDAYERLDTFVVWILGFSSAGIGFLVYQFGEHPDEFITFDELKLIIGILASSFICGVLYRLFSYYYVQYYLKSFNAFTIITKQYTSNTDIINPIELQEDNNIDILLRALNIEFGVDVAEHRKIYNDADAKNIIYKSFFIQYQNLKKFAIDDQKNGIEFIESSFSESFGIDLEIAKDYLNRKRSKGRWNNFIFSYSSYILNIPFYLSLTLLGMGYIVFLFCI